MSDTIQVAIVDDEEDMRMSISQFMSLSGFEPKAFDSAKSALGELTQDYEGVVVSDIRMPGMDGMELLRRLHAMDAGLPVIMITGHGDVQMAVEAMRIGAYDFIEKPFDPDRLADLVRRAGHTRRLTLDNRTLRRELADGTVLLKKTHRHQPDHGASARGYSRSCPGRQPGAGQGRDRDRQIDRGPRPARLRSETG